jgi:hypothetical protein
MNKKLFDMCLLVCYNLIESQVPDKAKNTSKRESIKPHKFSTNTLSKTESAMMKSIKKVSFAPIILFEYHATKFPIPENIGSFCFPEKLNSNFKFLPKFQY